VDPSIWRSARFTPIFNYVVSQRTHVPIFQSKKDFVKGASAKFCAQIET
jgi:hypothetical protein